MAKKFEIHPSEEEFVGNEDFSRAKMTPEEEQEAKKTAGVTTHEEAMERLKEREERMKRAEERIERIDWHNPEDFAFFEKKIEEAVESKEVWLDTKRYIDLFAVTDGPKYLDMAVEPLKESLKQGRLSSHDIRKATLRLIEQGKPEFIQRIIGLEKERDEARLDKYDREKIVEALLKNGTEPKKAVRYLPGDIPETTTIEQILEKTGYGQAYIQGLIKQGNLDKAREILVTEKDRQQDDLKMKFYLAAGERKEDLEILGYSNILELLRKGRVDKRAACEVVRKEIMSEIEAGGITPAGRSHWPYRLAELIKYSGDAEDIKLANRTCDDILKEIKTEKIALGSLQRINNEGNLFRLYVGLASFQLDKEIESKILGFLEKIDFSEPKEKPQFDPREEVIRNLSSSISPQNKKIADFILEKAQLLGDTYYKRAAYKLGEGYQKDRILESLEQEISRNLAKVKDLEGKRGYEKEEQELNKMRSEKQWLAKRVVFEDYAKEKTESNYQRVKKIILNPDFDFGSATEQLSALIDDLIEQKDYQKIFKFLDDPEISETSRRYLNWSKPRSISLLVNHLISNGELDKARGIVEMMGNEPQLVTQIIKELYKQGVGKEEIERSIKDYVPKKKDEEKKADLLFNSYLELMKLTK